MRRKHAFPAMFFIINERLRSPPYGTMFCAAPILSPRPAPFPTLSFPSTCQSEIMIEPGWQAGSQPSAMKARPHSLSVPPPFHAPLPPEVFPPHGLCGLSRSPPLSSASTVPVQSVFSPEEAAAVVSICPKKGKLLQTWLPWRHEAWLSQPWGGSPGIINK